MCVREKGRWDECTGCNSLNASMMRTRSSTFRATPDRPDEADGNGRRMVEMLESD